jgi:hypothetical protein
MPRRWCPSLLTGASVESVEALAEHGNLRAEWNGEPAIVTA